MTETPSNEVLSVKLDNLQSIVDSHNIDVKTGFGLVRDDIKDLRDDAKAVSDAATEAIKSAFEQHELLHDAHQKQHDAADQRFWAAVGILAGLITAMFGFLIYKGDFSNVVGMAGLTGGAVTAAIFFQQKVGFAIGVVGAYAYRTKTGARAINWLIRRTEKA